MSLESVDCGAGVVGTRGRSDFCAGCTEIIIVESQECIGSGISSRNSEMIHADIYCPTDLDKTRSCVNGKAMLYDFCREYRNITSRTGSAASSWSP